MLSVRGASPCPLVQRQYRLCNTKALNKDYKTGTDTSDPDKKMVNAPQDVKDTVYPRVEELEKAYSPETDKDMNIKDAMTFSGPGPEVINGRLAMGAFSVAILAEMFYGVTVIDQFKKEFLPILGYIGIIWVASIIPLYRGVSGDKLKYGAWNFKNELINGRAAMLGFAILLFTELATGHTLFQKVF